MPNTQWLSAIVSDKGKEVGKGQDQENEVEEVNKVDEVDEVASSERVSASGMESELASCGLGQ